MFSLHDVAHGEPLIDALARFGDGLPANVLPLAVNEVTQVGLETIAAAFAYGASCMRFLLRARPHHDTTGLTRTHRPSRHRSCRGSDSAPIASTTLETDDPEALGTALRALTAPPSAPRPASFLPSGGKRGVLRFALTRAAPRRPLHRST